MTRPAHKEPRKGERHFLNEEGMVACNPRDKEAAHRAAVEGIACEEPDAVTCRKYLVEIVRAGKRPTLT